MHVWPLTFNSLDSAWAAMSFRLLNDRSTDNMWVSSYSASHSANTCHDNMWVSSYSASHTANTCRVIMKDLLSMEETSPCTQWPWLDLEHEWFSATWFTCMYCILLLNKRLLEPFNCKACKCFLQQQEPCVSSEGEISMERFRPTGRSLTCPGRLLRAQ